MARLDPVALAHLEWIDFVQPTGLVVSAVALAQAGVVLPMGSAAEHQRLLDVTEERPVVEGQPPRRWLPDFRPLAERWLGWSFSPKYYAGTDDVPIPAELELALPEWGETLRPDLAVAERDPAERALPWQLLVRVLPADQDLEARQRGPGGWDASAHMRLERLLRHTGVPAGLLVNGSTLRLISAPRGESSGWLDFDVAAMGQTAGRPIAMALRLLLGEPGLLTGRKAQNAVSEQLAQQVLHALYELLRGFQSAHDTSRGELLAEVLAQHPGDVYHGLLTVVLRMVFLLYAEERDLLPGDEVFLKHYSLAGLHRRLREDAALNPDTMDQRFGAWAQLVVLFRLVHDGAAQGGLSLPRRHGVLFDPDRFPFLEARPSGRRQTTERIDPPRVPDGTIYRALEKLLVLDGERLSYRALDVEQIGSVYETMMGFRLETATGRSAAIKAPKKHGAPATVDLDALLEVKPSGRAKWLKERSDRKLTPKVQAAVKAAASLEDLHAALEPVLDKAATPDLVPAGALVLQPSEERRRSGSHYTPRELTEPIVRTTLAPILERIAEDDGRPPRPEDLLDLKVCDPAMGSGAFLVETCRQLGEALVESWQAHDCVPSIPPDEDERIHARRLVAQRCLYGVDRNPLAVDLAKVSLWLVTLARDHALTFVDHALRHGDSLVGLTRAQVKAFHWDDSKAAMTGVGLRDALDRVIALRQQIREAGDDVSDRDLHDLWDEARTELDRARVLGDLVVAAWFEGKTKKAKETQLGEFETAVREGRATDYESWLDELRHADPPLAPFHWEVEYPEVFDRERPGFDGLVGNPPFAGKNTVKAGNVERYQDWLKQLHKESHGNADLVAHFFRRGFDLLREGGGLGLIATNTIAQGDTRSTGLRWLCTDGGTITEARRRVPWPGQAAVIVSVVHVVKGAWTGPLRLDGREVETITAFLFHRGGHEDPARLAANAGKSFQGSIVLGMGFTFDDTDTEGVASPIAEMHRLIEKDPANQEVIFPYIGGEEVNSSPTQSHHRYVINFGERSEEECRERWPDLMAIVEAKVKPERMAQGDRGAKERWWQFIRPRPELQEASAGLSAVLVVARVGQQASITELPTGRVFSEQLIVFPLNERAAFCALQSRAHEVWARLFGSSMKDDLRYTPSDCFETFPFPEGWESHPELEAAGQAYHEFRARLMVEHDEGLTATYNRFHDPEERDPGILELRRLHAAMDRAVLDAYGWTDIPNDCKFLLDYPIDEETWSPRKRKPWRYRWPEAVYDEVLARLLELNARRHAEEQRAGTAAAAGTKLRRKAAGKRTRRPKDEDPSGTGSLFG